MRQNYLWILIFILICKSVFTQNNEFNSYSKIDIVSSNNQGFNILDGKLKDYELIVLGEEHFRKGNDILQAGLFRYLYQKENIRHLLIEYGPSRAILVNKYLETGDIKILRRISLETRDINFYNRLKLFYDTLPSDDKFRVYGVDYEKGGIEKVQFAINEVIKSITLKRTQLSKATLMFQEKYYEFTKEGEEEQICDSFLETIKKDSNKYSKEFGNYYQDLVAMYYARKVDYKKVKYNKKEDIRRDEREVFIYNQILRLKKRYKKEKFFCIYGTAHISLKKHENWAGFNEFDSFNSKLNREDESPFNSKILSIIPIYTSNIFPWKKGYSKKKLGLSLSQLEELDRKSKPNKLTLFEYPCDNDSRKEFCENYYQMILVNRMNCW